jgi:hypothetical protein
MRLWFGCFYSGSFAHSLGAIERGLPRRGALGVNAKKIPRGYVEQIS